MATKKKARKKRFNPADNLPPPRKKAKPGTTRSTRRHDDAWTAAEVRKLRQEIKENTPTRVLGLKHGRTEAAIRAKVQELDLSLMPVNRRPRTPGKKK